MNKADRKIKNQAMAAQPFELGIERRTGRRPVCTRLYNADMLKEGYSAHRCNAKA